MNAYTKLETRFRELALIEDAANMLHWDASTFMPSGAAAARGEQVATLSALRHRLLTTPEVAEWLEQAKGADDWQQANLREMKRIYLHASCLESSLVEALGRLTLESEQVWFEARAANDFARMKPYFERIIALVRESASVRGAALGLAPYDALLDGYDPGLRMAQIDPCFDDLGAFLPGAIEDALTRQGVDDACDLSAPMEKQEVLSRLLLEATGFDFTAGRLDVSKHPFCGGAKGDVRITTRYNPADFTEGLFGVLHEGGHALYERQLPEAWRYQPVGEARGMSLHESQSLFMEMQVGQSPAFMEFLLPLLKRAFGKDTLTAEQVYKAATRVERGLIRVTADEVTYPAHIILRYRLEKALIAGALAVADLPDAWAEGMRELVGIAPAPGDDKDGCLQDVHWPGGAFGYFPTYTLGALIAAQLMDTARRTLPELDAQIARGDFAPLQAWQRDHIHHAGSRYSTPELIERATGASLGTEAYKRYISGKYLGHP